MTQAHDPGHAARTARPGDGRDAAASVFSETADCGGAVFNAGLRLWEEEAARYVEAVAAEGRRTFARLCECKTPLEVLSVEQEWLRARSRFYLESGLRFADAFAAVARESEGGGEPATPPKGRA